MAPRTLRVVALSGLMACAPTADGRPAVAAESSAPIAGQEREMAASDTALAAALSATFRSAARRALPAVVHVAVERNASPTSPEFALPDYFRRFFDLPAEPLEPAPEQATCTGFLYDAAGLVLTSGHVVDGASSVLVRLRDGREVMAEVEGVDESSDVAVLRLVGVDGPFPTVEVGDSERLQVGDWVLALGNPLGLDFTVTAGIVSAKGRQLPGEGAALEAYLQTDAAINPGNSGGPLIDLAGRVVGMNAAIYGGVRYVGYGFAVPMDLVRRVAEDLVAFGHARRPRLGIRVSDVTAVDAEAYGLGRVYGAEVNSVEDGSPAERAGLRAGDVIVAVGADSIPDATTLITLLARRRPGDTVTLELLRRGARSSVRVTLGEFTRSEEEAAPSAGPVRSGSEERLGFVVEPLTEDLARRLGLAGSDPGALVVSGVTPYSAAARAGVRPGQRVVELEGRAVRSVDAVESIAAGLRPGEAVSLRVLDPEVGETVLNFRSGG